MPNRPAAPLLGKRILLTGGTTGIGRATLRLLIDQGASVLTCGRDADALDEALAHAREGGGDAFGIVADVATRQGIGALADAVDARLAGIDILVACAGLGAEPVDVMDDDAWRYVVETNLMGYLACARLAIERMDGTGGQLLFVSSISPEVKVPGESVYAATKGGVNAFAETLRKEVADRGIRVSVIEPGSTGSDMQPCSPEEQREAIARHEMLYAEEVADAILFALTRSERCDVMMLRIEPRLQKTA